MADRHVVIGRVINVSGMIGVSAALVLFTFAYCSYFGAASGLMSPVYFTRFGNPLIRC